MMTVAGETWNNVTHHDGWPSLGLRFTEGTDEQVVLDKLVRASKNPEISGKFEVYTTDAYTGGVFSCSLPQSQARSSSSQPPCRLSCGSGAHATTIPLFFERKDRSHLDRAEIGVCVDHEDDG
jgi:hypothetical protein